MSLFIVECLQVRDIEIDSRTGKVTVHGTIFTLWIKLSADAIKWHWSLWACNSPAFEQWKLKCVISSSPRLRAAKNEILHNQSKNVKSPERASFLDRRSHLDCLQWFLFGLSRSNRSVLLLNRISRNKQNWSAHPWDLGHRYSVLFTRTRNVAYLSRIREALLVSSDP